MADAGEALDALLEQFKRNNRSLSALKRIAHRVIFVPWTLEEGAEVIQQAKQTFPEVSSNGKPYYHVHYQPGTQDPIIKALSEFDEVYLVGHGHPFSLRRDALYLRAAGDSGGLPYDEACDRLIRSGLRAEWAGDLKIFTCYSANSGAQRFGDRSLASICATFFEGKVYACKVYGYEGEHLVQRNSDGHKVLSNQSQFYGERLSRHRTRMFTDEGPNRR